MYTEQRRKYLSRGKSRHVGGKVIEVTMIGQDL